jgi:hypothetical protein
MKRERRGKGKQVATSQEELQLRKKKLGDAMIEGRKINI